MPKAFDEAAIDLDAWVDAMANVLGFEIPAEDRAAVIFNLQVTMRNAALVESFPLDDEAEPAPVFSA
jgi:hypothetical protein